MPAGRGCASAAGRRSAGSGGLLSDKGGAAYYAARMSAPPAPQAPEALDLRERGAPVDGEPQRSDRRLFMQLMVFSARGELAVADQQRTLQRSLAERAGQGLGFVLYEDVRDPAGLGLLAFSEDPSDFVTRVRPACSEAMTRGLSPRPELAMLGRSYSTGYESDLVHWLVDRPRSTVLNPAWPWAVWYPLRRQGAFERLEPRERGSILREHGEIGRAYGAADLAHDVRLACHGLDENDNDFVIGLIGKELYPLSHVVQSMRRTRQTSEFMADMGPFFVGRAAWRASP